MAHPENRLHRFVISLKLGIRRAYGYHLNFSKEEYQEEYARTLRNTTKVCNCSSCCNARRASTKAKECLTMQERKQLEAEAYVF